MFALWAVQEMLEMAQELGEALTMDAWLNVIRDTEDLNSAQKRAARRRLKLLQRLASAEGDLWQVVEPGAVTVFSLGGPWVSSQDPLPLVTALLNAYSLPCPDRPPFQRLFLLDEVNRFDGEPQVWEQLVDSGRLIRHRGSMLLLLGQDFLKIPKAFWNLVGWFSLFQPRGREAFERVKEMLAGFKHVSFEMACALGCGEAYVAVDKSTDAAWQQQAQRVYYRPLLCEHGGHTKQVY